MLAISTLSSKTPKEEITHICHDAHFAISLMAFIPWFHCLTMVLRTHMTVIGLRGMRFAICNGCLRKRTLINTTVLTQNPNA